MKDLWNKLTRKQKNDMIIIAVLVIAYVIFRLVR